MSRGVIYNASGFASIVPQSSGSAGTLLHETGLVASADIAMRADYMALEAFSAGVATPVCTGGVLYDPDAPFGGGQPQYLGLDGELTTDPTLYEFLQFVGRATDTRSVLFSLLPVDPAIQELRAVCEFLLATMNGPSLQELLADLRKGIPIE